MVWGLLLILCFGWYACAQEQGAELLVYPHRQVSVVAGSAGSLTCVAYGQPQPTITWLKDGMPIANGSYATIYDTYLVDANMSFVQSILEICMFLPEQDGNYTCYTENDHGNFSFPFEIDVIYDEVTLDDSPSDTVVDVADEVTFECTASSLPSPIAITWYKDGTALDPNSSNITNIFVSNTTISSVLYLSNLRTTDAGLYSCSATDPIGGQASREFTFTIQSAVELLMYPMNSTAMVGSSSSFSCVVAGIPLPQIMWQRNGNPLSPDDYNITDTNFTNISSYFAVSILVLCDLQLSDSDVYSCSASNSVSQTELVMFTLLVEDVPKILTVPVSLNVSLGTSFELLCNVSGHPLPQVSWNIPTRAGVHSRDGIEEISQNYIIVSTLRISIANASEAGDYECVAENYLGNDTSQASIVVYASPKLTNVVDTVVYLPAGDSTSLECVGDGLPSPTITWQRSGSNQVITNTSFSNVVVVDSLISRLYDVDTTSSSLNIQQAVPGHEGNYTCTVTNGYGMAQTRTFNLIILTNDVVILRAPEDITVNTTEYVSFTCTAAGIPLPTISWYKDGSLVNLTSVSTFNYTMTTSVLDLGRTQFSDAGRYSCVASDPISGTEMRNFTLTLQSGVELILLSSNTTANASSSIALACMASGVPQPQIRWFKNGSQISNDDHNISESIFSNTSSYFTTSTLVLCDLVLSDSDQYMCQASNNVSYGLTQASGTIALMVEDAPLFVVSPNKETTLAESSTLYLNCTVSGLPLPQITWWRTNQDGQQQLVNTDSDTIVEEVSPTVVGKVSSSLTIRAVNYSHDGLYECVAENSLGTNSASADVTVFAVPTVTTAPADLEVHAGSMEAFTCIGMGIPTPNFTWFRNGIEIHNGTLLPNVFIVDGGVSSFTVESLLVMTVVQTSLGGNYSCVATNAYGADVGTFSLTILTDDVAIESSSMDTLANVNEDILFSCSASGIPLPTVAWYKDGAPLGSASVNMSLNGNGTRVTSVLSLTRLQLGDAGLYTCNASSSTGSTTRNFTLSLQGSATIVGYPSNSMVVAGNSSSFACIASGIPPPSVMWYKGADLLSPGEFNISYSTFNNNTSYFSVSVLSLCDLKLLESGVYGCVANNSIDQGLVQDSANFTLEVQEQPIFITSPVNHTLMESRELLLNCTVSGLPFPQVTWWRIGQSGGRQQVTDDGNIMISEQVVEGAVGRKWSQLLIGAVNFSHAGLYECEASNSLGTSVSANASVTVYVPASVIINNTDTSFNVSDNIILQCTAAGYPLPSIVWMKDGVSLTSEEGVNITTRDVPSMWAISLLEICNLSLDSTGNYECVATNDLAGTTFMNEERRSIQITVLDDPKFTAHPNPSSITVTAGEDFSLSCNATGYPLPSISWYLNSNPVSSGNGGVSIVTSSPNHYTVTTRITITRASLPDDGSYLCLANNTNPAGIRREDRSNQARVQFISPPQLVEPPVDRALFGIEDVTFSCMFESLPAATVTWTYIPQNGGSARLISNNTDYFIISATTPGQDYVHTSSNLTITRATTGDAGQYICNASNNVLNLIEAVTIGTGRLFFEESNFALVTSPTGNVVVVKDSVTLQCRVAAASTSDLTLFWTKDNKNFTLRGSSQQLVGSLVIYDLDFSNTSYADTGQYICTAHSEFYQKTLLSDPASLVVFVPASIVDTSPNTTRTIKDDVVFFCLVEGSHDPTLMWMLPDQRTVSSLNESPNISPTNFSLALQDVTLANTGYYTCIAMNTYNDHHGSDSQGFFLYVESQPRIDPVFLWKNDEINGSRNVTLSFNISEAAPSVTMENTSMTFTKYDVTVSSVTTFTFTQSTMNETLFYVRLSFSDVDFDDEGNYTLMTRNAIGSSRGTIHLDIKSAPVQFNLTIQGGYEDPVRQMYVIIEASTLTLTCSFMADPQPDVTWKLNGSLLQSTRHVDTSYYDNTPPLGRAIHTLTIMNVGEADSGNYTCEGSNIHGNGLVSRPVKVIVPPTVTAVNKEEIGVETRDGSPSSISVSFVITRADPVVVPEDIVWTYTPSYGNNTETKLINETDIYHTLTFSADRRYVTVGNLTLADAGDFTLIATNEAGTHNATVTLIIHVEPELLDFGYSGNETTERLTMEFWCLAAGYPAPNIVWLHNETLIILLHQKRRSVSVAMMSSPDGLVAVNSTLTVTDVRETDAGFYLCRVDPANINKGRQFVPPLDIFEVTVYPEPIDYCKSSPCQNGGICSNQPNDYLCICNPMKWKGKNCTIEIFDFDPPKIVVQPVIEDFPQLFTEVDITCEVRGTPQPNITWYKDGKLLEGQRTQNLVIEEVTLQSRGIYRCEAENYDPNKVHRPTFTNISSETVLNVKGIAQYKAELTEMDSGSNQKRRKRQTSSIDPDQEDIVEKIASSLSGLVLQFTNYNATVYSVMRDPLDPEGSSPLNIIITLLTPQGSAELKEAVLSLLEQTLINQRLSVSVNVANITRFDGCESVETVLEPLEEGGLSITLTWPEANLGEPVKLQCPCGNLSAVTNQNISNAIATRVCGGNFSHGGEWEQAMVAPCNFSSTTRQLCQVANLLNMPEEAISRLDNITSDEENIRSTEIGVTTILLEAISGNPSINQSANLTTGFLTVVDNLLDANKEDIQMSQQESNSSARILAVVEAVSERIPFPENQSQVIVPLSSFAIAVQEVTSNNFKGQVFSAGLGADFNFDSNKPIDANALMIGESSGPAAMETASLEIPNNLFKSLGNTSSTRITNSVFLNDALFLRRSNTSVLVVGGIIIAAALSMDQTVENLPEPQVRMTFLKKPEFENGTNISCKFWDFSADGGYGDWSDRGCELVTDNDTMVECKCNHLTNFAMLLDPNPDIMSTLPPIIGDTLSAISYIGAIVSIICLIVTIVTYLSSKKLRVSEAGQLLMNLCLALLGLYIMYIVSVLATKNDYVCAVSGGLLHYFMLASFLAMAAEAVSLYTKLVLVLGIPPIIKNKYVLKTSLIIWILPFIIVLISEAPDWTNYVSEKFCRPYGPAFYGGLMTPFILIYLFNWVVFVIIFTSLLRKKATKAESSKNSGSVKLKQNFIIAVTLSLLFGLGWGIGLVATTSIPVVGISYTLQTLFVLLTCPQGLLIFIMHCVRSEEARKQWKSWLYILTFHKINLEGSKKSILTGHASSDYGKGTQAKYNKYSTLSTSAQGSQTLQRILKKEMDSSMASHSDTIIDNENSVFSPSLEPLGEEKKIDLSSDAMAAPTENEETSNPFVYTNIDKAEVEINQGALEACGEEMEMKETNLSVLAPPLAGSETNSLHSVKIQGEDAESKSLRGEADNIINEFDILWVKDGSAVGSRLSVQSAGNNKRKSQLSGMDVTPRASPTPTGSNAELPTKSNDATSPSNSTGSPVMSSGNDKAPLIGNTGSDDIRLNIPDENTSNEKLPTTESA